MDIDQIIEENIRRTRYGEILLELPYFDMTKQIELNDGKMEQLLTIVITTSPIPTHPNTNIIESTIDSLMNIKEIKNCKIIITFDGCNDERFNVRYEQYKININELIKNKYEFRNVICVYADEYVHQTNTIRNSMKYINTPFMFVIEHDWLIFGDIKFREIISVMNMYKKIIKCVRLNYLSGYMYSNKLYPPFVVPEPIDFNGVKLIYTDKWSCHPHISHKDSYEFYFHFISDKTRCYMEEILYGMEYTRIQINHLNFYEFGTWIYGEPSDNMLHIRHIDGRNSESMKKVDSIFIYKNNVPDGAPFPAGSMIEYLE